MPWPKIEKPAGVGRAQALVNWFTDATESPGCLGRGVSERAGGYLVLPDPASASAASSQRIRGLPTKLVLVESHRQYHCSAVLRFTLCSNGPTCFGVKVSRVASLTRPRNSFVRCCQEPVEVGGIVEQQR